MCVTNAAEILDVSIIDIHNKTIRLATRTVLMYVLLILLQSCNQHQIYIMCAAVLYLAKICCRGGAQVYKAIWNGTTVAVKMLNSDSDSQRLAFVQEANMLQNLRHPNVVSYLGCAVTDHNKARCCCDSLSNNIWCWT